MGRGLGEVLAVAGAVGGRGVNEEVCPAASGQHVRRDVAIPLSSAISYSHILPL